MTFPTLYKRATTGALLQWTISVMENCIITRFGQVDGAIQETRDTVKAGKNLGKKNATTAETQAQLEAESKWRKQIERKGYVENRARAEAGETDTEGGIAPMLAQKFHEQEKKVVYPCYLQPKLDGERCIGDEEGLWSRSRKAITGVPHIQRALVGLPRVDGELYQHEYHDDFEQIMSFVRSKTPKEGHEIVQYHVYDIPMEGTFTERLAVLQVLRFTEPLILVPTFVVADKAELTTKDLEFVGMGYEGSIVRNAHGTYEEGKRSMNLLKLKAFDDGEFPIVRVIEGRGRLAGHAGSITCLTAEGVEFEAKLKGKTSFLKELFENETLWKGKMMNVRYKGFTNKNNVPRFPVGMRIREVV